MIAHMQDYLAKYNRCHEPMHNSMEAIMKSTGMLFKYLISYLESQVHFACFIRLRTLCVAMP